MRIRRHRKQYEGEEPPMTQSVEQARLQSAVAQVQETIERAKAELDRIFAPVPDASKEPDGTR